ncbi:hypothetical protein EDF74_3325 [Stenotrophomonas rhizophila]|nr:hypothetical protein EDF74_3325 [Stenotrophomonas rhizophila]
MKSTEAVEQLDRALQDLAATNPETARQLFESEGLDVFSVSEIFHGWWVALHRLSEDEARINPQTTILDVAVSRAVRRAKTAITRIKRGGADPASNGNSLISELGNISVLVGSITGARAAFLNPEEQQELRRALDRARKVSSAAEDASTSIKEIEGAAAAVRSASDQVREDGGRARTLLADAEVARASLEGVTKTLTDRAADAERLHSEIQSMREGAEAKRDHYDAALDEMRLKGQQAEAYLANTVIELKNTLDSVKRHGLASAFSQRASELRVERYIWIALFVIALGGLAVVSIVFAASLESLTYEAIASGLFRRIALAAPLIWLGWYAAKQVGTISKLKEDYDYKAATALAFEGYQKEVMSSGNDGLVSKLLGTAISNFGDNPVRLYRSGPSEAASPSEELLSRILKEGGPDIAEKVRALFK